MISIAGGMSQASIVKFFGNVRNNGNSTTSAAKPKSIESTPVPAGESDDIEIIEEVKKSGSLPGGHVNNLEVKEEEHGGDDDRCNQPSPSDPINCTAEADQSESSSTAKATTPLKLQNAVDIGSVTPVSLQAFLYYPINTFFFWFIDI